VSAEQWEVDLNDEPEPTTEVVETLVAEPNVSAVVCSTGYGNKGIEVRVGEHIIVVGVQTDNERPHIQIYGPDIKAEVQGLRSGRSDHPRRLYINLYKP
jgi:hypothetical protein